MRSLPANGETICELRRKRGWTQLRLAQLAGCAVRTIRNAERGRQVGFATLNDIASAFEVPLATLSTRSTASDLVEQRNLETILRWHELYVANDIGALLEMHHKQTRCELPGTEALPFGGDSSGLQQYTEHLEGIFEFFPIVRVHEMAIEAVGNRVYARPKATLRVRSTGEEFTLMHANVFELEQDRILHRITYSQVGMFHDPVLSQAPRRSDQK